LLINGLQKLTLLDYPGKTACTVFLSGCNFRCPYCHNAGLVVRPQEQPVLGEADFFAFLKKRRNVLEGVCITGGEPTLRADLEEFAGKIKRLGYSVKLDTNGTRPEVLSRMIERGLIDYAAMDIKSSKSGYSRCAGVPCADLRAVQRSIDILSGNKVPYEYRTTVVRELHSADDMVRIGRWLKGAPRYFLQKYKDSGDTIQPGLSACEDGVMSDYLAIIREYIPDAQIRG
jgi:pyruvate formate lyase activating enzyme